MLLIQQLSYIYLQILFLLVWSYNYYREQIMNKEGNDKRVKQYHQDYVFSLRKVNSHASKTVETEAYFPPVKPTQSNIIYKSVPIVLAEHHQLLNLFHLPFSGPDEPSHMLTSAITLGRLREQLQTEHEVLYRPKPRFNHCHVCKCQFQNYQTHIETKEHVQRQQNNPYNKLMAKLCRKFVDKTEEKERKTEKNKDKKDMTDDRKQKNKKSSENPFVQNQTFLQGISREDLFIEQNNDKVRYF